MLTNRRQLLKTLGLGGMVSLAGCSSISEVYPYASDEGPPEPSTEDVLEDLTIKTAPSGQENPYFVAFSEDLVSEEEFEAFNNQQVRIQLQSEVDQQPDQYLFTVNLNPSYENEDDENTIWVSKTGMARLDKINEGTTVKLKFYSASPVFSTRLEGSEKNELIEQTIHSSEKILFIASHGGGIYSNTELQAIRGSSEANFSSWALMGYGDDRNHAIRQWYNPPEFYATRSFYNLMLLDPPFSTVVSFAGHETDNPNEKSIIIGGLAPDDFKETVKKELARKFHGAPPETPDETGTETETEEQAPPVDRNVDISIASSGDNAGLDPTHIANELSSQNTGAIIISQSQRVRENYWEEVSDALISAVRQ